MENAIKTIKHFSLHFTTKDQEPEQINRAFVNWLMANGFVMEGNELLYHCFIPRKEAKNLSNFEIISRTLDVLDNICKKQIICRGATHSSIEKDRDIMMKTLKHLSGTAFFIGKIIEGVKIEHDLAVENGVDVVLIEL
jgi:hypothetical protein